MKKLLSLLAIIVFVFVVTVTSMALAESSLRVVWGSIDYQGNIISGSGFTTNYLGCSASWCETDITFNRPFAGLPTCVATVNPPSYYDVVLIRGIYTENSMIGIIWSTPTAVPISSGFTFICVR
jgi:hypothetical protein